MHPRVGKLLYWVSRHLKQQAHLKKERERERKQISGINVTTLQWVIKTGSIKCPQTIQNVMSEITSATFPFFFFCWAPEHINKKLGQEEEGWSGIRNWGQNSEKGNRYITNNSHSNRLLDSVYCTLCTQICTLYTCEQELDTCCIVSPRKNLDSNNSTDRD